MRDSKLLIDFLINLKKGLYFVSLCSTQACTESLAHNVLKAFQVKKPVAHSELNFQVEIGYKVISLKVYNVSEIFL